MDSSDSAAGSYPTRRQGWTLCAVGTASLLWVSASILALRELGLVHAVVFYSGLVTALPAILLGLGFLARAHWKGSPTSWRAWTWSATCCFALAAFGVSGVLGPLLRVSWDDWRIEPTLPWCDEVVGRIQTYHAVHGEYPSSLDELGDLDPPWGTRELWYDTYNGNFTLRIGPPPASDEDLDFTGFNGRRCAWIVRGDPPEPEVVAIPSHEQLRYLREE